MLYSYDDPDNHEKLDERAVMTIVCLHGTYFRNIRFENIRVNRCERLVCLTFKDSFWFGSIAGDQSSQERIENIVFKAIASPSNSGSSIANEILLNGWFRAGTPTKEIQNVTFDCITVGENLIDCISNTYIKTNNTNTHMLVKKLKFKN